MSINISKNRQHTANRLTFKVLMSAEDANKQMMREKIQIESMFSFNHLPVLHFSLTERSPDFSDKGFNLLIKKFKKVNERSKSISFSHLTNGPTITSGFGSLPVYHIRVTQLQRDGFFKANGWKS